MVEISPRERIQAIMTENDVLKKDLRLCREDLNRAREVISSMANEILDQKKLIRDYEYEFV